MTLIGPMKAPGTTSRLGFVDHTETYGPKVIEKIVRSIQIKSCLDIGAGNGRDLSIVKKNHPNCALWAVDFRPNNEKLIKLGCKILPLDIERDSIPVPDESIDFVVANQTMEHVKEIYWINHEVFRVLSIGGYFVIGVPNLLALHNRILPIFGFHPTCIQMISAHIRGYSIRDTVKFYETIGSRFLSVERVLGAQFYPLPKIASRFAAAMSPGLSSSIFFKIKKTSAYSNEFQYWTRDHLLETNFFTGQHS